MAQVSGKGKLGRWSKFGVVGGDEGTFSLKIPSHDGISFPNKVSWGTPSGVSAFQDTIAAKFITVCFLFVGQIF